VVDIAFNRTAFNTPVTRSRLLAKGFSYQDFPIDAIAARMPIIATTTKSSANVYPLNWFFLIFGKSF
jgi:hypothetical protein